MKYFIAIFVCLFLFSCGKENKNNANDIKKDSVSQKQNANDKSLQDSLKKMQDKIKELEKSKEEISASNNNGNLNDAPPPDSEVFKALKVSYSTSKTSDVKIVGRIKKDDNWIIQVTGTLYSGSRHGKFENEYRFWKFGNSWKFSSNHVTDPAEWPSF